MLWMDLDLLGSLMGALRSADLRACTQVSNMHSTMPQCSSCSRCDVCQATYCVLCSGAAEASEKRPRHHPAGKLNLCPGLTLLVGTQSCPNQAVDVLLSTVPSSLVQTDSGLDRERKRVQPVPAIHQGPKHQAQLFVLSAAPRSEKALRPNSRSHASNNAFKTVLADVSTFCISQVCTYICVGGPKQTKPDFATSHKARVFGREDTAISSTAADDGAAHTGPSVQQLDGAPAMPCMYARS